MSAEIGFAVVGLGMGRHHCRAVINAPGARLVGVCDIDPERLGPAAEEYDCKGWETLEQVLADDDVDVVNIATPSGTHVELALQVVAAGKNLIVEKPADIRVDRIDELIEAVNRAGVKAGGIFQSRLDPLNQRIRNAVADGTLGNLIGVHGHLPWYRKQTYYEGAHGSWKGTWDMDGGGSLMNQGVHTVDLLQWFAGPVASVSGMFGVFGHEIEAEDQTVALLRFECGAIGTLFTTTCAFPGFDQRLMLYGSKGAVSKREGALDGWKLLDDEDGVVETGMLEQYGVKADKSSGSADPMAVSFDGHTQILIDMIEAIGEDRPPRISLESARHAVEIINAIYESGRTGKEIHLGRKG